MQSFLIQTEKQTGISVTLMLTLEQKLCCKLKEENTKYKEIHYQTACEQVVDHSAPYELIMASTIKIFRSWFICSHWNTASFLESVGTP